jgi:hypothetical protein
MTAVVLTEAGTRPRSREGIERQLDRLALRLLAEVAGDPERELRVRHGLAEARLRFRSATVRDYLPILVERAVRQQLRSA